MSKNGKPLSPEQVEWVVNDIGELGVRISGTSFFLYKGESIVYPRKQEDGSPMKVRRVQKREFGEVCRPPGFQHEKPEQRYDEGDGWTPLT